MISFEKWDALNTVLVFGKYKGWTIQNVLEENPGYLQWLLDTVTQGSILSSLTLLQKDSLKAIEREKEEEYEALAGYPTDYFGF